eukprot:SAG11_NODE_20009_length_454_cov_1.456338_1_plen_60_part_10
MAQQPQAPTAQLLAALARRGHLKLALPEGEGAELSQSLLDTAWAECSAFCDYWMLGHGED